MKNSIKNLSPIFKLLLLEPCSLSTALKLFRSENRVFLFGTPHHGNLGDHLIAVSELDFFSEFCPKRTVIDCTMRFSKAMLPIIKKHIKTDDVIAISGGGWLGTEWRHNEDFVRRVIISFPQNRIVIFPQTAFYKEDEEYLKKGRELYSNHNDLYFCARDSDTFDLMEKNRFIDDNKLIYMPDMALFSKLWPKTMENHVRNHIGLCMRDDREAVLQTKEKQIIINTISNIENCYVEIRTNETEKRISPFARKKNLIRKLEEIASLRLLVTDRLHAMIMAAITDTPCIALDNSTHKVKGVYEWIKELDYIVFLDSVEDIEKVIKIEMNRDHKTHFSDWNYEECLNKVATWFI